MNHFLIKCLILCTLVSSVFGEPRNHNQSKVPKDFRYPESQETVQVRVPIESKSLAGRVVDSASFGLEKVLVERLSAGWRRRQNAMFTDSEGAFVFRKQGIGRYYLRLSKPGFKTLLVRVLVTNKSQSSLRLVLGVSH